MPLISVCEIIPDKEFVASGCQATKNHYCNKKYSNCQLPSSFTNNISIPAIIMDTPPMIMA